MASNQTTPENPAIIYKVLGFISCEDLLTVHAIIHSSSVLPVCVH
jgi:hypothetical protein